MFPAVGAALFFIWILFGISAPGMIMNAELPIPVKFKKYVALSGILLGPVFPLFIKIMNAVSNMVNFKKEAEKKKEQQVLNKIMLENASGMFLTDKNCDDAEASAINTVKKIILTAVERRASDIFLDPQPSGSYTVRMRIDGTLRQIMDLNPSHAKMVVSTFKVVSVMDITEHRRPQDGAFSARINDQQMSFRSATVGAYAGEKLALRLLGAASGPRSLADLGLDPDDRAAIEKAIKLPSGMVLMCGPTGSGKTSTLYAMLKSIDYTLKNVMSIEDPIENVMPNISQMEVNPRAGITFAQLLRNALRQNPDIICLGEIRDEETAGIAVQAAQTGHLIIATVHSNDNLGTVDRLQNLGVPLRTIAATLHVIISQRLIRTLCPHCKRKIELPDYLKQYFTDANLPTDNVCAPTGCPKCDGTGFSGRRAVFDIMIVNKQLRDLLEKDGTTIAAIQEFIEREHGSSIMAYKGYALASQGLCPLEEVERIAMNME